MPNVMILCPVTGKPIPTSFAVESEANLDFLGINNNEVACPECNQTHIWNRNDAFLEGEQPLEGGQPPAEEVG